MQQYRLFPLLDAPGPCPVCAAPRLRTLHSIHIKPYRLQLTKQVNQAIVGCEECGIVHTHPLTSEAELQEYYAGEAGWQRAPLDPDKLPRKLAAKHAAHREHLEVLESLWQAPEPASGEPARAIDVGCGLGGWLDVLQDRGWETWGVEPAVAGSVAASRHRVVPAVPDDLTFQLSVLHHTLEHLRDPLGTLKELASVTSLGGAIFVSVPSLDALPEHRKLGYAIGDKHLFSYTSKGIASLFALAGFELLATSTEAGWSRPDSAAFPPSRLVALGRRVAGLVPLPDEPLRAAVDALLAFERTEPVPPPWRPKPPPPTLAARVRRVPRRLLREAGTRLGLR